MLERMRCLCSKSREKYYLLLFCALSAGRFRERLPVIWSQIPGVLDPYGEIMALSHQVIDLVLDRDLDGLQKLIHPDGYSHFTNAMGSLERGLDRHWRLPGVSRSNHFVDFKSIMFTPDMSRAAVEIRFMNVDWYVAEYAMEMYFRKHNGKWMLELDYSYIE